MTVSTEKALEKALINLREYSASKLLELLHINIDAAKQYEYQLENNKAPSLAYGNLEIGRIVVLFDEDQKKYIEQKKAMLKHLVMRSRKYNTLIIQVIGEKNKELLPCDSLITDIVA